MNAPIEPLHFSEEIAEGGDAIPSMVMQYQGTIEHIRSASLKIALYKLLEEIQASINKRKFGKTLSLIHRVTFEYGICEGVTQEDVRICVELYGKLLSVYEHHFESVFPDQFRKRTDQILKKTPD